MKYFDGQEVMLNDLIRMGSDSDGRVVCIIESNKYIDKESEAQWSYLKKGAVIETTSYGAVHYPDDLDSDIVLVSRANNL
jgi:hypothetical protein